MLRFYAKIFGLSRSETDQRIDRLMKLVELEHARKRPIRSYSKGMQQRVGLGRGASQKKCASSAHSAPPVFFAFSIRAFTASESG